MCASNFAPADAASRGGGTRKRVADHIRGSAGPSWCGFLITGAGPFNLRPRNPRPATWPKCNSSSQFICGRGICANGLAFHRATNSAAIFLTPASRAPRREAVRGHFELKPAILNSAPNSSPLMMWRAGCRLAGRTARGGQLSNSIYIPIESNVFGLSPSPPACWLPLNP